MRFALLGAIALAVVLRLTADRLIAANSVTYHAGWNLVGAPEGTRYAGADGPLYTLQPNDDAYQALPAGTRTAAGLVDTGDRPNAIGEEPRFDPVMGPLHLIGVGTQLDPV